MPSFHLNKGGGRMDETDLRIGKRRIRWYAFLGFITLSLAACSPKLVAVNLLGDALSGSGGAFVSDDDPDLIREAIPFGLKTYEALLDASPEHRGLLLAAASGFTAYAYLIQDEADRLDASNLFQARIMRARAQRLYLRGRNFALRGLEVRHPGLTGKLRQDPSSTLASITVDDVPYLYWAGAAWAGALTAAKDDLNLLAELPIAAALVDRALELDEKFDRGVAHEFFISYEGGRPGGSVGRAREHYRRALEISGGLRASVHLALAEAVTIREQNIAEFRALIGAALAVDPDKVPSLRLANTIAQRRARWLQTRIPELFVTADNEEATR
jgi:predicted anti-sigma-YlaC factor YlaD